VRKIACALLLLLAGCGSSRQPSSQEVPLAQVDLANSGTITGRVSFEGKPVLMPILDMSANPACERLNKQPRRAEQVVVNSNGTLRNTFVWIASGLPSARWNPPAAIAKLDQEGCVYEPHVLGMISNSDTVNHNIHAEAAANASWNETEAPRAEKKLKRFEAQEVMFPVTCGVHPWMRSYIGVVAHPFFEVTGDNGTFTLKGVPPGTYTLEAIHEKYGKQQMQITVAAHEAKDVEFRYDARASN
jgi:hypothetical protein